MNKSLRIPALVVGVICCLLTTARLGSSSPISDSKLDHGIKICLPELNRNQTFNQSLSQVRINLSSIDRQSKNIIQYHTDQWRMARLGQIRLFVQTKHLDEWSFIDQDHFR